MILYKYVNERGGCMDFNFNDEILEEIGIMMDECRRNCNLLDGVFDTMCDMVNEGCRLEERIFHEGEAGLAKILGLKKADLFAAKALYFMYKTGIFFETDSDGFGVPGVFDFIRIMLPITTVVRNGYLKDKVYGKLVFGKENVDGFIMTEAMRGSGIATYSEEATDYGYIARTNISIPKGDIVMPALFNGEEKIAYIVTPSYVEHVEKLMDGVSGNVLLIGLGAGYMATELCARFKCKVTVLEKNPGIIAYFEKYIKNQIPYGDNIEVLSEDYLEYMGKYLKGIYDYIIVDIKDFILNETAESIDAYVKMRKAAAKQKKNGIDVRFAYNSRIIKQVKDEYCKILAKHFNDIMEIEEDFEGFGEDEFGGFSELLKEILKKVELKEYGDVASFLSFENLDSLFD